MRKAAAMFGLDARIALAIFGALSVIIGVALYGALKRAEATAILTDLNEMVKAFEAYWIDTGTLPTRNNLDPAENYYHLFNSEDLIVNPGVKGWKGPYLNYERSSERSLKYPKFRFFGYRSLDADGDLGGTSWSVNLCVAGKICSLVIKLADNIDDETFHALDEMVDKGDGVAAGSVRGWKIDDADDTFGEIYYVTNVILPNPLG